MYFEIVVLLILPFFMAQQDTNEMDTKDNKRVSKNDRMGKCEYLACYEAIFPTMMTNNVSCCSFLQHLPARKVPKRGMRNNRDGCGGHLLHPL